MDPDAVLLWTVCDSSGYGLNVNYPHRPPPHTHMSSRFNPHFPSYDHFKALVTGKTVQLHYMYQCVWTFEGHTCSRFYTTTASRERASLLPQPPCHSGLKPSEAMSQNCYCL